MHCDVRDVLLTIHILSAAAWIGGVVFVMFWFPMVAQASGMKKLLAVDEALGGKYFGVSVLVLVLTGVGLVLESEVFGFGDAFVLVGFGAIVGDGVVEGLSGPALKRIARSDRENPAAFSRLIRWSGASHAALLAFAVWSMVAKWGT